MKGPSKSFWELFGPDKKKPTPCFDQERMRILLVLIYRMMFLPQMERSSALLSLLQPLKTLHKNEYWVKKNKKSNLEKITVFQSLCFVFNSQKIFVKWQLHHRIFKNPLFFQKRIKNFMNYWNPLFFKKK